MKSWVLDAGVDFSPLYATVDEAASIARQLARRINRSVTLWGEHRGVTFYPRGEVVAVPSGERLDV